MRAPLRHAQITHSGPVLTASARLLPRCAVGASAAYVDHPNLRASPMSRNYWRLPFTEPGDRASPTSGSGIRTVDVLSAGGEH
jgi:hypothetical protein